MAVIPGDINEITYNHPSIGTGVFFPKSGEDGTFDPGGFRTSDDANNVDGGGRSINQLNRVRWMLESTISWDMNVVNELDTLSKLAASPVEAEWTIQHCNGTIWKGLGTIVGDVKGNSQAGTIGIKISGGSTMKKIG